MLRRAPRARQNIRAGADDQLRALQRAAAHAAAPAAAAPLLPARHRAAAEGISDQGGGLLGHRRPGVAANAGPAEGGDCGEGEGQGREGGHSTKLGPLFLRKRTSQDLKFVPFLSSECRAEIAKTARLTLSRPRRFRFLALRYSIRSPRWRAGGTRAGTRCRSLYTV